MWFNVIGGLKEFMKTFEYGDLDFDFDVIDVRTTAVG